ncbi:hypothetical protein BC834DRAFT_857527, partial [Gloeopeniophorella convolvens]
MLSLSLLRPPCLARKWREAVTARDQCHDDRRQTGQMTLYTGREKQAIKDPQENGSFRGRAGEGRELQRARSGARSTNISFLVHDHESLVLQRQRHRMVCRATLRHRRRSNAKLAQLLKRGQPAETWLCTLWGLSEGVACIWNVISTFQVLRSPWKELSRNTWGERNLILKV